MYCPVCRSKETKVVDSRVTGDGMSVRRRRSCVKCAYRFSTVEETELLDVVVVKQDGQRESYRRDKLKRGIIHSLVKRPYTEENFNQLIQKIERDIQKKKKREITSTAIGELVMKYLKKFDKIAYIRFASIYRAFADVENFESEIEALQKKRRKKRKAKK